MSFESVVKQARSEGRTLLTEIEAKGLDDVVRREELDRINKAIDDAVAMNEKFAARLKRKAAYGNIGSEQSEEEREEKAFKWWAAREGLHNRRVTRDDFTEEKRDEVAAYKRAFDRFLRNKGDDKLMSAEDMKALSVGSDPDGGFLVEPDTSGSVSPCRSSWSPRGSTPWRGIPWGASSWSPRTSTGPPGILPGW